MKEKQKILKNIRLDYSNPESQEIFSKVTILLADITKYIYEIERQLNISREDYLNIKVEKSELQDKFQKVEKELKEAKGELDKTKGELDKTKGELDKTKGELARRSRTRYMVKALLLKLFNLIVFILGYIPTKVINKLKKSSTR